MFVRSDDLGSLVDQAPRARINVIGKSVLIELNRHAGEETTAQELIDAVNRDPAARQLVAAAITSGLGSTKVGNRQVDYSPLELVGPGSSFDTATTSRMKRTSVP